MKLMYQINPLTREKQLIMKVGIGLQKVGFESLQA